MSKLSITEYNHLTGKIIERFLTDQEKTDFDASVAITLGKLVEQEVKAAARTSALAKLAELGLTAEEIAAL